MYHAACKVDFQTIQSVVLTADVFQFFIKFTAEYYTPEYVSTERLARLLYFRRDKRFGTRATQGYGGRRNTQRTRYIRSFVSYGIAQLCNTISYTWYLVIYSHVRVYESQLFIKCCECRTSGTGGTTAATAAAVFVVACRNFPHLGQISP